MKHYNDLTENDQYKVQKGLFTLHSDLASTIFYLEKSNPEIDFDTTLPHLTLTGEREFFTEYLKSTEILLIL